MRKLNIVFALSLALVLSGCGSSDTADKGAANPPSTTSSPTTPPSSTTGGSDTTTGSSSADSATSEETAVVGNWVLDLDATKFEPSEDVRKQMDAKGAGTADAAVAEMERQMKEQLGTQLKDGQWTFNADKTADIKTATETSKGTWSLSGKELTLKTEKQPESKMILSDDGMHLTATISQAQGTITLALKKS